MVNRIYADMKAILLISIYLLLSACQGDCEKEIIVQTPIVSDKGKVGAQLKNEKEVEIFINHLESRYIDYKIDADDSLRVWWYPYNNDHRKLVYNEAFGHPVNQISLVFPTKEEASDHLNILVKNNIQHVAQYYDKQFVVVWDFNTIKQRKLILNQFNKLEE